RAGGRDGIARRAAAPGLGVPAAPVPGDLSSGRHRAANTCPNQPSRFQDALRDACSIPRQLEYPAAIAGARMKLGSARLLMCCLWLPPAGWAQVAAPEEDPEVVSLRTEFEHGKYEDVLQRAASRINRGNLTEQELIELHKLAGLSAFYLRKMAQAENHLVAVIQIDPDYSLDPFLVAPPAIQYFEKLRAEHSRELEAIREQRRLRAERLRREAEDRERARREAEEQRRRLSNRITVERVENRSYLVNFLPFGAGQFQQGRTREGVILAATEGVLAVTSVIAYFAYRAQIKDIPTTVNGYVGGNGTYTFTQHGIPADRWREANAWRITQYASGGGFWLTYALGVVDALIHHKDQVVTRTEVEVPSPAPAASDNPERPKARVVPARGGVGAGVSLAF